MKILKFGGTSLKNSERIEHVIQLISAEHPCAVVVSAFGGVTDHLVQLTDLAALGKDYSADVQSLFNRHHETVNSLGFANKWNYLTRTINDIQSELTENLETIAQEGMVVPKLKDAVLSTGERLSANIITVACIEHGLKAEFLDTRAVILTDDHFGDAFVHYQVSYNRIRANWKDRSTTRIITGFIGATEKGETTTFGRSGSDYTASIFGAALNVEEIEIWTDVNGILTADPSVVSDAQTIPHITYEEAMELAHAGAKVIFPPTMIPALYKSIPIRIKNTFHPNNSGTLITQSRTLDNHYAVGISSLYNIALIRFQGAGIVGRYGVIGRVFEKLAGEKINIILVSQVFSEHSICFAINPKEVELTKTLLHKEFSFELENRFIDSIQIEENLSLIAVVGEGMRHTPGIAGKLFGILGNEKVNLIAIAQGSSERNISFIVNEQDVKPAIRILHSSLFSGIEKLNIFIAGTGLVGTDLIRLISQNETLIICGISNSKKMILDKTGINPKAFQDELKNGQKADLDAFITVAKNTPNSVFVDVTSSSIVAEKTAELITNRVSVVTASKLANSMEQDSYDAIREKSKKTTARFLYEANVGAGLPIIETLQTLLDTGDIVIKIEGIMSGTLGYLFNEFDNSVPFSELVKDARKRGFTEPDPRDDLNGMDVARKILILARETGARLELTDVTVESLIPEDMSPGLSIPDFLEDLSKYNHLFSKKLEEARKLGKVLRYIASWDGEKAVVSLKAISEESPFFHQYGQENIIVFTTKRYHDVPMVIKGHGAGGEVTAAAVLGDILKCKK